VTELIDLSTAGRHFFYKWNRFSLQLLALTGGIFTLRCLSKSYVELKFITQ